MTIKNCRECGEAVSTEAKTCPKCGVPHPTESGADRLWRAFGTIVIGVFIGDFIFGWGLVFSSHRAFVPPPVQISTFPPVPMPASEVPQAPPTATTVIEKSTYSFADLRGILDIYSSNQALFYSSIKGKRIRATAPYKALSKSLFSDDEYSLLAGNRPFQDIRCSVPAKTATSQLTSLSKGDTIVVDGIISDVVLGTLVLTPCIVER